MSQEQADDILQHAGRIAKLQPSPDATDRAVARVRRVLEADGDRRPTNRVLRIAVPSGLAAGIVLAVAIILAVTGTNGTMALADVEGAVAGQRWVHAKYDTGPIAERWTSLADGKGYWRRRDGEIGFWDFNANIRLQYHKDAGYVRQDKGAIYAPGQKPEWEAKTAWKAVVGPYEQMAAKPRRHMRVESHADTEGGRKLIRFDWHYKDAAGREILLTQLWADPKTRLPVRSRRRLQLAYRKQYKREWANAVYDFPAKGPDSIYAMGVPHDARIVKTEREHMPDDVKAVLARTKAAWRNFPKSHRAVIWNNDRKSAIDVVHRRGSSYRKDHYIDYSAQGHHLPLPASATEVLQWARKQTPVSVWLFDGERRYSRSNHVLARLQGNPRPPDVRVLRETAEEYFRTTSNPPVGMYWPLLNRGGPARIVPNDPDAPVGCVTVRFGGPGKVRQDYIVDPNRDYICIKWTRWQKHDGQWRKVREEWLFRLRRLETRQWYATRRLLIYYGDPTGRFGRNQVYWSIDVKALKDDQFPEGIFDGTKLLEGATVESH